MASSTAQPLPASPSPTPSSHAPADRESSAAAVSYERVSFSYPGVPAPALVDVSLLVAQGERLGILGPNGGGKSTLLKLTLGLLSGNSGVIRVFGMSPEEARKRGVIGYVPQRAQIERAFPISARQVVESGAGWRAGALRPLPLDAVMRVERMLALVGAETFSSRPIGKLSGGQLQRVLIARALAANARILALDEPLVGIDAGGQQLFADLLARVHAELGVTIITISHDIRAIAAGSDRVACLSRRLHSHTSPHGLTPQVLAELFAHDLAGLGGQLGGMHLHAHGPGEACPAETVALSISTPKKQS